MGTVILYCNVLPGYSSARVQYILYCTVLYTVQYCTVLYVDLHSGTVLYILYWISVQSQKSTVYTVQILYRVDYFNLY